MSSVDQRRQDSTLKREFWNIKGDSSSRAKGLPMVRGERGLLVMGVKSEEASTVRGREYGAGRRRKLYRSRSTKW